MDPRHGPFNSFSRKKNFIGSALSLGNSRPGYQMMELIPALGDSAFTFFAASDALRQLSGSSVMEHQIAVHDTSASFLQWYFHRRVCRFHSDRLHQKKWVSKPFKCWTFQVNQCSYGQISYQTHDSRQQSLEVLWKHGNLSSPFSGRWLYVNREQLAQELVFPAPPSGKAISIWKVSRYQILKKGYKLIQAIFYLTWVIAKIPLTVSPNEQCSSRSANW